MKARCDWCGIQVEVLSDGKCLLGHPVRRANRVQTPLVHEPPAPRPPGIGIEPSRGRVRTTVNRTERRPKAPTLGDAPALTRPQAAVTTKPTVTDPPTRLPKASDARPARSAMRPVVGGRTVPRPAAAAPTPAAQRTMRKWVPLDPFGPSGPVEFKIEEPAPPATEAAPGPPQAAEPGKPRTAAAAKTSAATPKTAARTKAAAATTGATTAKTTTGPASRSGIESGNGHGFGEALRSIDWRSGAERTRDACTAALRAASNATASAAAATARTARVTGAAITRIDFRGMVKRLGPLSPQNPAMWVAGLCIAGVALLIGLRVPGQEAKTQVLGSKVVAAAELTEVPGYTLEADPQTEAEVAAQQPTARKVSAANVRDGSKVLARYQAIAFGPEIRWTSPRQREWLDAYARGAQIPEASFTERPLGRRWIWSAPLGTGQAAVYFYGSEVMVLVTGQRGVAGDQVVDAVLTARGV